MESLQIIKQKLTDNLEQNLEILQGYLKEPTKTEDELFLQMEICKYMKNLCLNKPEYIDKYAQLFLKLENKYVSFIFDKINIKNQKKQWESILFYISKVMDYYNFNNAENNENDDDYYTKNYLKNQEQDSSFYDSIESNLLYRQALAYFNLENYDIANSNVKKAIKLTSADFSIENFTKYYEITFYYNLLFECLLKLNKYDELKTELNNAYLIAMQKSFLAVIQYYWGEYYYYKNNISVAKTCAFFSSKNMLPLTYKTKLINLLEKINNNDKIISLFINQNPETILEKYNIPLDICENMKIFVLSVFIEAYKVYKKDKNIKNKVSNELRYKQLYKLLLEYGMNNYVEEILTNFETDYNMYHFENYKFSLNINKKWKVAEIVDSEDYKRGVILFAINNEDNLYVTIRELTDNNFEEICKENIDNLKFSGFNIIKDVKFTTMKNKEIKYNIVKLDNNNYMLSTLININNYFVNIYSTIKGDYKIKEEDFLTIINSISNFSPIIHKDY